MDTNNLTVQKLRQLGWKVRVMKWRNANQKAQKKGELILYSEHTWREYMTQKPGLIKSLSKCPRGGKVIVELTPPSSTIIFTGISICHPLDNFDRKVGIQRAIDNALKKI